MYNSDIRVTSMDPNSLSEEDFWKLNEVTQDMWADWIWEFVQCVDCWRMHSKKDIFWHLKPEVYGLTVKKIMWDFEVDTIRCTDCWGKTTFIYGRKNIDVIKDRLTKTKKAFLVIAWNKNDDTIVWYEDAYIDTLDSIYAREYEYHYKNIGISEIRTRISDILWYTPAEYVSLSDIGFLNNYRTFRNIFLILSKISQIMPEKYANIPWLTELDKCGSLHKICSTMWWTSLWLMDEISFFDKISNIGEGYKSDLLVCHGIIALYKQYFSGSAKSFIQLMKTKTMNTSV